jgi:hypothetical protein
MRRIAPAYLALSFRPTGPDTLSRTLDASRLRRATRCAPVVLQTHRFRARAEAHGSTRGMGYRAKHRVPLRCRHYISGLVLRDAERAPRSDGTAPGDPRVAACGSRIATDALDRRSPCGVIVIRRGEAQAR